MYMKSAMMVPLIATTTSFLRVGASTAFKLSTARKTFPRNSSLQKIRVAYANEDQNVFAYAKEEQIKESKVEYNWEKEWYPLYLKDEMPSDAPLGLTVFDRQIVLFNDASGGINCLQDRCPHRLAKLSEGQLMEGRLECLYHGWQFNGDGSCSKIPQLPSGAKIPQSACARSYEVKESQGVIWVWMGSRATADATKIPWFEHYARPEFGHVSTIHELPYDHSILLENLMDPAHVPISHDRTDLSAKRENAKALLFELLETTSRGFAGKWDTSNSETLSNFTRFEAPCCLRNDKLTTNSEGEASYFSAIFLCRPAGQGKSMLIVRFGSSTLGKSFIKWIPPWFIHRISNTVFEQDMGFLSSQNETLLREASPTKEMYLGLKSVDVWVLEYRKWLDRVGHGMPYYFGYRTLKLPTIPAAVEANPAGIVAANASSYPSKGAFGSIYARDPTNRYFRHVIHCKSCMGFLKWSKKMQIVTVGAAAVSAATAIVVHSSTWRNALACAALLSLAVSYACSLGIKELTTNFVRGHRK